MESLNPKNYRKALLKKLEESDLKKEEKIVIKNKIILGEMRGTPLDDLRRRLFSVEEDEVLGNEVSDEEGATAPTDTGLTGEEDPSVIDVPGEEGDLLLGGDETEDYEDEEAGGLGDMEDPEGEGELEEPVMSDAERNMDDLVADTILEILTSFKEIRDGYVAEDPDKADIVRKIYDYLFKAKDKIANEITKANQESQMPPRV